MTWTDVSANGSSVTFVKTGDSNYMSITVPTGCELPSDSFGNLTPIKISETKDTVTYRLAPKEIAKLDYVLKTSVTLETQIKINVYIPAKSTLDFTFNGEKQDDLNSLEIRSIDGEEYYVVSVSMPSASAADEITLTSTVAVGDTTANASFTLSIPRYAQKVLNDGSASSVEKKLVKDILAYVRSAYNYFDEFNTPEKIASVNELVDALLDIGESYERGSLTEGVSNENTELIEYATLNLNEKPTVRFYVKKSGIEFFADGKRLNTVSGYDETHGDYVELDVYAYVLADSITYSLGEERGSYHVSDYIRSVMENGSVDKHEELTRLALSFVKYTESAKEYRASVVK